MKKHLITTILFIAVMYAYYSSQFFIDNAHSTSVMLTNAEYIEWQGSLIFAVSELVYVGLYKTIYEIVKFINFII